MPRVTHPSPKVTRPLPLVAHHRTLVTHPFPKEAHPLGRFGSPLAASDAPLATGDSPLAAGVASFSQPAPPHLAENQPFMPKPAGLSRKPNPNAPPRLALQGSTWFGTSLVPMEQVGVSPTLYQLRK